MLQQWKQKEDYHIKIDFFDYKPIYKFL